MNNKTKKGKNQSNNTSNTNMWGQTGTTGSTWAQGNSSNTNNSVWGKNTTGTGFGNPTSGSLWGSTASGSGWSNTASGSGWSNTASGSGWGNSGTANTQQQNFLSSTPKEPIITPVCTIGLPFAPTPVELDLKSYTPNGNIPQKANFPVNHICQMEIFNKFTIDEIRYYDYLHEEYIIKVKPEVQNQFGTYGNTFGFGNTTNTAGNTQNKTNNQFSMNPNQEIIQKNITPWKRKPEEIKDPQAPTQKQPFGALPATTINIPQIEGEDTMPKRDPIPENPGFRNNMSLYHHILKTKTPKSATPGIHSLIPEKLKDEYPSKKNQIEQIISKKQSAYSSGGEKNSIDNNKYIYIPDLASINDEDEIYNFKVIHPMFGSIVFTNGLKVKKIKPEENIVFEDRKVNIKSKNIDKANLGINNNFISIVTLNNVFPNENREQESLREYETDLMKFCSERHLNFISYNSEDGTLMFSVPSLSIFPIQIL